MINKNKMLLVYLTILSFIITSCSKSVDPENDNKPFMSISIGDERQFFNTIDSSTIFYIVKEKLKRSDGLDIYAIEWYYGSDTIPNVDYYAIKDGYFISTEKDSVCDLSLPNNPFFEQRLAKIYPNDGDIWQSIPGNASSPFFVAKYIGTQITPAGIFPNTFSFTLGNFLSVYYSKGVGHIKSVDLSSNNVNFVSCYLKVNNKIYGTKIPPKDPKVVNGKIKEKYRILSKFLLGTY